MKKNVIVTRIDVNGVNLAKQLFASIHCNAGWTEDLLLLSHKLPENELVWFKKRGIIIKYCKPLYPVGEWPEYSASKLYVFEEEMKKWEKIICLDADIIVRSSLNLLTECNGFSAVREMDQEPLFFQFNLYTFTKWMEFKKIEQQLGQRFNLLEPSFNGGVLVIDTKIIKSDTFSNIEKILKTIRNVCAFADQSALNLYFYKKWNKLPRVFNLHPMIFAEKYKLLPQNLEGIILHFTGNDPVVKPNHRNNPFYHEWKSNFNKADLINRKLLVSDSQKPWSMRKIWIYGTYLETRRFFYMSIEKRLYNITIYYNIIKFSIRSRYHLVYKILKIVRTSIKTVLHI